MKYIKYLWAVLRHKWFVALECFKVGLLWRGIVHDWSKFLPDEFIPYANVFYGDGDARKHWEARFDLAWNKHQKRHDHHWQFWLLTNDDPGGMWGLESYGQTKPDFLYHPVHGRLWFDEALYGEGFKRSEILLDDLMNTPERLPMSEKARLEMLCDWRGAGRAYGNPDTRGWYLERRRLMRARLHSETRVWVEKQLGVWAT